MKMEKKEYVRPNIIVRDVDMKKYSLLRASYTGIKHGNSACETWTDNMNGVLGGKGDGVHGSFHNGFDVNSEIWGSDTGAL